MISRSLVITVQLCKRSAGGAEKRAKYVVLITKTVKKEQFINVYTQTTC